MESFSTFFIPYIIIISIITVISLLTIYSRKELSIKLVSLTLAFIAIFLIYTNLSKMLGAPRLLKTSEITSNEIFILSFSIQKPYIYYIMKTPDRDLPLFYYENYSEQRDKELTGNRNESLERGQDGTLRLYKAPLGNWAVGTTSLFQEFPNKKGE